MRYLGAHVSTSGGVDQAPLRGKEIDANTIQLFAKNNNQWLAKKPLTDDEVKAFQKNKKSCGIKIAFSHAGYLINLASPDEKNHALSLQSFLQELERADTLGLDFVVLHPGAHVGSGLESGIAKIAESINQAFDQIKKFDGHLLLETTAGQGTCIGHRFEHLAAIFDLVEAKEKVGICLDTAHVFVGGYDIRADAGYQAMWKTFDKTIGLKKIKAIHLNDSKKELGSRVDRHEHIGLGLIGETGFRLLMQDKRFLKTPMVLETPKRDDPVKYDRQNLRKLLSFCR